MSNQEEDRACAETERVLAGVASLTKEDLQSLTPEDVECLAPGMAKTYLALNAVLLMRLADRLADEYAAEPGTPSVEALMSVEGNAAIEMIAGGVERLRRVCWPEETDGSETVGV
jgi:hypothetical protein